VVDLSDIELLENEGWEIQSREPFIIRHSETHSFATRDAAEIILESYKRRRDELQESVRTEEGSIVTNASIDYFKSKVIDAFKFS
jgi:hypothetical protein